MTAYLLTKSGAVVGARYPLEPNAENLLGRDWSCTVAINDPQCSRVHAEIVYRDGGWWVMDRQSSNGTFVNGQQAREAQLSDQHEIRLGSHVFTFLTSLDSIKPSNASDDTDTNHTVVVGQLHNPQETGQYTFSFLQKHAWGEDFFFLFQLSVKLLSLEKPDDVISESLRRLYERTDATTVGFFSLNDRSTLAPSTVYPPEHSQRLTLTSSLTRQVVQKKQALRVEHDTGFEKNGTEGSADDSICVPLIQDDEVIGALYLVREGASFADAHFELAGAVTNLVAMCLARALRAAQVLADRDRLTSKSADSDELIGECQAMLQLKAKIGRVGKASGCVLIRGESGSGKELVARAIHRAGPRASRPMLCVNCAAIPQELMESQLFGHKKGAFTSADSDHVGWFQQADLGTLFLDEIGELNLEGQAKLLRILEGYPFLPVGASTEVSVDVRVICATNRDLSELVAEKQFREDLFYRLSVFEVFVPPLRERGDDIRRLIDYFFDHFRSQHGRPSLTLSTAAIDRLTTYHWPGNVRQLRNVIDSAIVMCEGESIEPTDLGIREASVDDVDLECLRIDHWERKLIRESIRRTENNVPKAAKLLGMSRATLYRKISEYGIDRNDV